MRWWRRFRENFGDRRPGAQFGADDPGIAERNVQSPGRPTASSPPPAIRTATRSPSPSTNLPAWATLQRSRPAASPARPTAADVATYSNIRITVSDGKAIGLDCAFAITVDRSRHRQRDVVVDAADPERGRQHADRSRRIRSALRSRARATLDQSVQVTNPSRQHLRGRESDAGHLVLRGALASTSGGSQRAVERRDQDRQLTTARCTGAARVRTAARLRSSATGSSSRCRRARSGSSCVSSQSMCSSSDSRMSSNSSRET